MYELLNTDDGSTTVRSGAFGVTYHSRFGALQESKHVFIEAGLVPVIETGKTDIRIFEVGFGTGLNAWLAALEAAKKGVSMLYEGVEAFPIPTEMVESLDFWGEDSSSEAKKLFYDLHQANWDEVIPVSSCFSVLKRKAKLETLSLIDDQYDVVFFDAFAPQTQPELWTEAIFSRLFKAMRNGGTLVTYCAKGDVKRALKAAGFWVEALPGPPGKREMTRAVKREPV